MIHMALIIAGFALVVFGIVLLLLSDNPCK